MADYYEQQRRENQRRWEESQRQERQLQDQQRREQERRDQDRRLQERLAAERYAREVEADRRRDNQRVLDQQRHQREMADLRERDAKALQHSRDVRENLNEGQANWSASISSSSHPLFNCAPQRTDATGLEHQPIPNSPGDDAFKAIDDCFWKIIQKGALPIGVIGAIGGAIFGWYWPPLGDSIAQWKSVLGCALFGIPSAFLVVALLRQVVKAVLIITAIVVVGGLAWLIYQFIRLLFGSAMK